MNRPLRRGARRGGIGSVLLRRLPRETPVHRLWIGTKLIALLALTIATGLNTGWVQLGALAALVGAALAAARVPWGAWPRLPGWFWLLMAAGFGLASVGGGAERLLRLLAFTVLFMVLSLLIAWTTDLAELAPTLRTVLSPLRRVGLPVDEWSLTTALAVRCLPLLLDECRVVYAAHSQRVLSRDPVTLLASLVDVISASMAATVRRAADLGEVITLRGGPTPLPPLRVRLHARDLVALVCVACASVLPGLLA